MSSIGSSTSGGLDSLLLGYYQAQLAASPSAVAAASAVNAQRRGSSSNSATANDVLPWNTPSPGHDRANRPRCFTPPISSTPPMCR